ncbi:MAG: DUF4238 domain-containing protein [Candidatus Thorarchaeota archaeon]
MTRKKEVQNKKLSTVRIQHYVPQFYLKQFSQRKRNSYYLKCFDKSELKSFTVNTTKIACESYFFDPPGSNQPVERWLTRLERRFAKSYDRLIEHQELKKLSSSDRVAISNFLSVQWVRTREYREVIRDFITQLKNRLEEKNVIGQLRDDMEIWSQDDFIASLQIEGMKENVRKITPIIRRMKWILLENNTNMPYWTSDHPFTRYNPVEPLHPYMGNLGLLNRGIQILFPLTPKLSLTLCDPIAYGHYPNEMEAEYGNAVFGNELQVDWSTRHLFSATNDFSLAKRRIEKYPEAGSTDRQRIQLK